jgi:hypothetical protein
LRKLLVLVTLLPLLAITEACGPGDRPTPPARVAGIELADQQLRLAGFRPIQGTNYLYAPLVFGSSYSSYGSDASGRAKDLLFFDATNKSAHWLLADSSRRLRFYSLVLDPPLTGCWLDGIVNQESKALGILFESVPDPMSEDLAVDQQASIGFAAADGTDPAILIRGVSGLLGNHLVSEESLIVFYNREGELWAANIAPATRTIRSDSRVSAAPQPRSE